MLDYKVLKLDHGVSYGSVTLKSLQNDYIPELDLLVREAIQNSSDASLEEPEDKFKVNFTTGYFKPEEFNKHMTGLHEALGAMFPGTREDFLEIRDTKTCGLTGPCRKEEIIEEDHGNFFKLIFDTGKRQTIESAGGNWGFGKSVYYRVGIGIVVFYSRVKTGESYESRLIITLVEDESKKKPDGSNASLLYNLSKRSVGKAWWGKEEGEDLLPITDPDFIDNILDIFGLVPFKEDETGTSIIIPYINSQQLLEDIVPHEADLPEGVAEAYKATWGNDIESYLRLAIQKWYAPKIHNRELRNICNDKKWLHVSVNNKSMQKQDMLPFFRLVQELYTSALAKTNHADYTPQLNYEIITKPIRIMNYFSDGNTIGYVATTKISKTQLYGDEGGMSPYIYCGRFEAEGGQNEPIVMYTRDPGMVIDYSISGLWVKGIPWPESEEEYIFGFFVPDTKKELKADLEVKEHAGKSLGEYLRSCEASDHMGWSDPAKMNIVVRIQKNTSNQITKIQTEDEQRSVDAKASRLSGKLGRLLMPRVGYGKTGRSGGDGGSSGGRRSRDLTFDIIGQQHYGKSVEIGYKIKMAHTKKEAIIDIVIDSEGGRIDFKSWRRDIGTPFPVTISKASVMSVCSEEMEEEKIIDGNCTYACPKYEGEIVDLYLNRTDGEEEIASFKLESHIKAPEIIGTIRIYAKDKRYSFSIKAV